MKKTKRIALALALGTTGTVLQSQAVYTEFVGPEGSSALETSESVNTLLNQPNDLAQYDNFSQTKQYYQHLNFLKSHNTGEFLHIHPTWLLVSNPVIERRGLKVGSTYQTSLLDQNSPKFKILNIVSYVHDNTEDAGLLAFSLIQIAPGDSLIPNAEPANLIDQAPITIFTGIPERKNILNIMFNSLDQIITRLIDIQNGKLEFQPQLVHLITKTKSIIKLINYPGVDKVLEALKSLKQALKEPTPEIGQMYDDLVLLVTEIRTNSVSIELEESINKYLTFLATPYSHTKENKLVHSHQYIPAFCRLEAIKKVNKQEDKQEGQDNPNPEENNENTLELNTKSFLTLNMVQSNTAQEGEDNPASFSFSTMEGEDTGQPIFAYDPLTNKYSILSINQIPKGETMDVPVLSHPSVIKWLIDTTGDNYLRENYADLITLSGIDHDYPTEVPARPAAAVKNRRVRTTPPAPAVVPGPVVVDAPAIVVAPNNPVSPDTTPNPATPAPTPQ